MKLTLALLLSTSLFAYGQEHHRTQEEHGRESGAEHGGHPEGSESGEPGESGTQYGLTDTAEEIRSGIELSMRYDAAAERFTGAVTNTTATAVDHVRVEVHLSNGTEIGPSPRRTLGPGETLPVVLAAPAHRFTTWSVHVEIGAGEH